MDDFVLDLRKGGNDDFTLDLSKASPGLKRLRFQVEWSMHPIHGRSLKEGFDLDVSAFFLNKDGIITSKNNLLFFNNKNVFNGAGVLPDDERAGGTEFAIFDITKIPAEIAYVDMYVNIFEARERVQTFLMMTDATVKLINEDTSEVIQTFSLASYTNDNTLHVGTLEGAQFKAVGVSADRASLQEMIAAYRPH